MEQERKFRPFLRGRAHGLLRQYFSAVQQAHHHAGTGAAQPKRSAQGVSRVYRVTALLDARIGVARDDSHTVPAVQWQIRIQCDFAFTCGVPMPRRRGNAGEQRRAVDRLDTQVGKAGRAAAHAYECLPIRGPAAGRKIEQQNSVYRYLQALAVDLQAHVVPAPVFHCSGRVLQDDGLRPPRPRIVDRPRQFETAGAAHRQHVVCVPIAAHADGEDPVTCRPHHVERKLVVPPRFRAELKSRFRRAGRSLQHFAVDRPCSLGQSLFEAAIPHHLTPDAAVDGVIDVFEELTIDLGIDRMEHGAGVHGEVDGLGGGQTGREAERCGLERVTHLSPQVRLQESPRVRRLARRDLFRCRRSLPLPRLRGRLRGRDRSRGRRS